MSKPENLLRNLRSGDIFHGHGSNGAEFIALVTEVRGEIIEARTMTSQIELLFDRETGESVWTEFPPVRPGDGFQGNNVSCVIDSIAPLPLEIHEVLLGLDRKMRLERDPERVKFTEAEKNALLFISAHYPSFPLSTTSGDGATNA